MGKGKQPRKRRNSVPDQIPADEEDELERQTQPKGELVPPTRLPPTALATESPQPPQEPVRVPARRVPAGRPVLFELLQTLRTAVGAMLDIADAAADAITKRLEGRA
jgi:hypothetical protein